MNTVIGQITARSGRGEKMRNIMCKDCAEYKNEWCKKIIDSPYPDMLRDCQYFHEIDRDIVRVVRCKDCTHYDGEYCRVDGDKGHLRHREFYCGYGERREER